MRHHTDTPSLGRDMRLSKTDEQQYVDDEYLEALAEEEDTGVNHNHQYNEEDYSTGGQDDEGYLEGDEDGHWMPEKTTPVSPKHDTSILAATQGLTLAVQDVADSCTGDVKVRISYLTGGENDGADPVRGYEITTPMTYLSIMSIAESTGLTTAKVYVSYRRPVSPGNYQFSDYKFSGTHPLSPSGFVTATSATEIAKMVYY